MPSPAGVTSFAGHIYGSFPPGRIGSVAGHARHMLCMLRAHTQAYDLIKSLPGGWVPEVGWILVHINEARLAGASPPTSKKARPSFVAHQPAAIFGWGEPTTVSSVAPSCHRLRRQAGGHCVELLLV